MIHCPVLQIPDPQTEEVSLVTKQQFQFPQIRLNLSLLNMTTTTWTNCTTYYRCVSRDISSRTQTLNSANTPLMFNDLVSVRTERALLVCVCVTM